MTGQVRRSRLAVAVLLVALAVLGWLPAQAQDALLRLRLLSTTDIHTYVVDYDYYRDQRDASLGLSRTAALIHQARAEVRNSLLFDSGDAIQGNPLGDYVAVEKPLQPGQVHPVYRAMNQLGYAAASLGNHEFNYGLPFLRTALADRKIGFIIADLPADALLKAADAVRDRGTVLFNAGSIDDRLREEDCRANVIHAAPTRSMLADGLAQYLVWKQWKRWLLVVGSHAEDKLFAEALRRAASRFGAKIVQERVFEDTGGARRTDSGVTLIQRQMPVFTQQAPAYDILVAADESEVFAPYLPYRTWDPRPVAGSAGLVPKSWDAAQDQWGAVQMQNRFLKLNSRHMTALDMQAWTAARMIGEAVTRKNSGDPKSVLDFLKGPDFSIAAFKGQRLTLRDWNLQLRQPILLVDGRMIVSVSPQEGFLHQVSELDTLGLDRPETKCKLH
jgi:ABC transporter substrate binding protein (PQQ-dependent alcohol dehydrogenase system)